MPRTFHQAAYFYGVGSLNLVFSAPVQCWGCNARFLFFFALTDGVGGQPAARGMAEGSGSGGGGYG